MAPECRHLMALVPVLEASLIGSTFGKQELWVAVRMTQEFSTEFPTLTYLTTWSETTQLARSNPLANFHLALLSRSGLTIAMTTDVERIRRSWATICSCKSQNALVVLVVQSRNVLIKYPLRTDWLPEEQI